jgi:hypothetical protein
MKDVVRGNIVFRYLKTIVIAMVAMMATVALFGCSANESKSTDEQFVEAVGKGLEARWAISDSTDDRLTTDLMNQAISKERDAVKEFREANFENEELGENAEAYFEALDELKGEDYNSSSGLERWMRNYNMRCAALYNINEIKEIPVSQNKQSNLDELLNDGKTAAAALDLMEKVDFVKQEPEYPGQSYIEYKAVVENSSSVNFSYFTYQINLVDQDGVVIENTTASTNDWAAGTKHAFEFTTDKKFEKMEISSCWWNL